MSRYPYAIYTLPARRRAYDVQPVYPDPELTTNYQDLGKERLDEEDCPICYRAYSSKDDPSDPAEIPCHPIRLLPCRHVIGSDCFTKLVQADLSACQICRTEIKILLDPFPLFLQKMTSLTWYKLYADWAPGTARRNGKLEEFTALNRLLFGGTITVMDGLRLWWFYMTNLNAWTNVFLGPLLGVKLGVSLFDIPSPEIALMRAMGMNGLRDSTYNILCVSFPLTIAVFKFVDSYGRQDARGTISPGPSLLLLIVVVRLATVVIGIWGFVFLLAVNWILYGILTGALIFYGIKYGV